MVSPAGIGVRREELSKATALSLLYIFPSLSIFPFIHFLYFSFLFPFSFPISFRILSSDLSSCSWIFVMAPPTSSGPFNRPGDGGKRSPPSRGRGRGRMTTRSQTSPSGDVANQPMSPSQMSVDPSVQSGSGKGPKHSQPPVGTPGAGRSNLQATPVAQPTVAQPHLPQAQVHPVAAPVELPTPVVAAPVDAAVVSPTPSRRSRDQEEILDAIRALTMTLSNNQNHGQGS